MMLIGFFLVIIEYLFEICGLGIINVMILFGVGVVCFSKKIIIVVYFENWDFDKYYDCVGLD